MSMTINETVNPAEYNVQPKSAEIPDNRSGQSNVQSDSSEPASAQPHKYDYITKDGDTLNISANAKAASSAKTVMSDVMLAGYSESRLKQLYSQKEITKQQYDKALKAKGR